jgi:hypothetical protein
MTEKEMCRLVAETFLQRVCEKRGRKTDVSNICHMNRSELTVDGLMKMKGYRLMRVMYALLMLRTRKDVVKIVCELIDIINDCVDEYDGKLLEDSFSKKHSKKCIKKNNHRIAFKATG